MDEEYKVTIPLDEYRELIEVRNECDNLVDFIFNTAAYNSLLNQLELDEHKINIYLKNTWAYNYNKKVDELKKS